MSTAGPAMHPPPSPRRRRKIKAFWVRVTEGMELNQLWSQFFTEARTSYRLYSRELKRIDLEGMSRWQRARALAKQFFWAVMMKLSPARRVILLAAVVLLVVSAFQVEANSRGVSIVGQGPGFWGGILLLILLVLEIADRVTMKRDLEIARDIQHWLVPDRPPEIAHLDVAFVTRPANTVAGDYYDVLPMQPDGGGERVLLALADVAGKSIPAALLMATFQASLRTLVATCNSLPELVAGVNRYACAHSLGGLRFTTAYLAALEPATGSLLYTNCGHNAPLLRKTDGAIQRLEVGGVPLGIQADCAYACGDAVLQAGDLLVMFTDGVVEAENGRGEEYGEGRLVSLVGRCAGISAHDVIENLMLELDRFVGDASQHDDITCMVVRRIG